MAVDPNVHYDFKPLLAFSAADLLLELADAHSQLANLHVEIAFLRREESRQTPGSKDQRIDLEAVRDAVTEKKWLILKLLDTDV